MNWIRVGEKRLAVHGRKNALEAGTQGLGVGGAPRLGGWLLLPRGYGGRCSSQAAGAASDAKSGWATYARGKMGRRGEGPEHRIRYTDCEANKTWGVCAVRRGKEQAPCAKLLHGRI